jgi:hypothetical protein
VFQIAVRIVLPIFALAMADIGPVMGADSVALYADSIAAVPRHVEVSRGAIYFAGNRISAPMTIGYCGEEFCINGLVMETPPRRAVTPMNPNAPRSVLDRYVLEVARDARRQGFPYDVILRSAVEAYCSSALVEAVSLESDSSLSVYYVNDRFPSHIMYSRYLTLEDPPPEYFTLRSIRIQYGHLLEMRRDLESGNLVVYSDHGHTILDTGSQRRSTSFSRN